MIRIPIKVYCKNKLCDYEGFIDRYESAGRLQPFALSDTESICHKCGFKTLARGVDSEWLKKLKVEE